VPGVPLVQGDGGSRAVGCGLGGGQPGFPRAEVSVGGRIGCFGYPA
jgi:hypothetical protein